MPGRSQARKASATRERVRAARGHPPRAASSRPAHRPGRCTEAGRNKTGDTFASPVLGAIALSATAGWPGRLDLLGSLLGSLFLLRGCLALPHDPLLGRLLLAALLGPLLRRFLLRLLLRSLLLRGLLLCLLLRGLLRARLLGLALLRLLSRRNRGCRRRHGHHVSHIFSSPVWVAETVIDTASAQVSPILLGCRAACCSTP